MPSSRHDQRNDSLSGGIQAERRKRMGGAKEAYATSTHRQSIFQSAFRLYQPALDGIVFVLERMISRVLWLAQDVLCHRGQGLSFYSVR